MNGYEGRSCQTEISFDMCRLNNPCKNGGECHFRNVKKCYCPPSYTGENCEILIKTDGAEFPVSALKDKVRQLILFITI